MGLVVDAPNLGAIDVRVNLRSIELLVTEYILQHSYIDLSGLKHKSSGSVTKLMYRQPLLSKPRKVKILINHPLYGFI